MFDAFSFLLELRNVKNLAVTKLWSKSFNYMRLIQLFSPWNFDICVLLSCKQLYCKETYCVQCCIGELLRDWISFGNPRVGNPKGGTALLLLRSFLVGKDIAEFLRNAKVWFRPISKLSSSTILKPLGSWIIQ